MSSMASILKLDLRGVARDNVMVLNIGLSVAVMIVITIVGVFKSGTSWAEWFPFLLILSVLTGPPAYGFLFGLLMVDERDMGVRAALAVTPVPAIQMLVVRTLTSIILMIVWPLITIYVMNATWQAIDLPFGSWLALVCMLSLVAPLTALAVATYATNKVEAMALFKGINMVAIIPLALYFLPAEAFYRYLFLVLPPAWGVFAFDSLLVGDQAGALAWLAGGAVYLLALLLITVRAYVRSTYKTND